MRWKKMAGSRPPLEADAFRSGWRVGRPLGGGQKIRERSAALRKQGCDFATARRIAQVDPEGTIFAGLGRAQFDDIDEALEAWELGATLRDMAVSSRQAAHVVSALKQLGASDRLRKELTVIDESLRAAITILGHKVEGVELRCDLNCSRPFAANQGS